MKAILTLNEMPENCEVCPFNYDMFTCLFIPHSSTILMDSERLNDCPLKELPEREPDNPIDQAKLAEKENLPIDWTQTYCTGWNACIDEITGSED